MYLLDNFTDFFFIPTSPIKPETINQMAVGVGTGDAERI